MSFFFVFFFKERGEGEGEEEEEDWKSKSDTGGLGLIGEEEKAGLSRPALRVFVVQSENVRKMMLSQPGNLDLGAGDLLVNDHLLQSSSMRVAVTCAQSVVIMYRNWRCPC